MSEQEFDLYLSLLSRFLRLSPRQRAAIADELRDHLETRLEELTGQGLSREQAIRAALEEFGDAAELADHFGKLAQARRRRIIMRLSAGSAAALTAGILFVFAMWPENPAGLGPQPQQAVAQAEVKSVEASHEAAGKVEAAEAAEQERKPKKLLTPDERNAEIEKILDQPTEFQWFEEPLESVLQVISQQHEIQIVPYWDKMLNDGIEPDTTITLSMIDVRLSTALAFLLEKNNLAYGIRDGVLYITTQADMDENENNFEVRVYDCSDLIKYAVGSQLSADMSPTQIVELRQKIGGELNKALRSAVRGLSNANHNAIEQFGGTVIVRHNRHVQRDVENVLKMLRTAAQQHPLTFERPITPAKPATGNEKGQNEGPVEKPDAQSGGGFFSVPNFR